MPALYATDDQTICVDEVTQPGYCAELDTTPGASTDPVNAPTNEPVNDPVLTCADEVTQPGYCAELDTVPPGRFAWTCVELLTVPPGRAAVLGQMKIRCQRYMLLATKRLGKKPIRYPLVIQKDLHMMQWSLFR